MDETNPTLLRRAGAGVADAWEHLDRLYRPFLHSWFRSRGLEEVDANDLTQEVLLVVVANVRDFSHPGHRGAFRKWLRSVCLNRLLGYRRSNKRLEDPVGGSEFKMQMHELHDSSPDLEAEWDRRHDQAILRQLIDNLDQEFEARTMRAFRRLVLDGATAAEVASEMKMSIGAVYIAKSRVLRRIRADAEGLVDDATLS